METMTVRQEPGSTSPVSSSTSVEGLSVANKGGIQAKRAMETSSQNFSHSPRLIRAPLVKGDTPSRYSAPPQEKRNNSHRSRNGGLLKAEGLSLNPGETHIWKWKPRKHRSTIDPSFTAPVLSVSGNQSVRVVFMSYEGGVIKDVELVCSQTDIEIPVPMKTRIIAAIGMGGAGQIRNRNRLSAGEITTDKSTNNRAGVGFQSTNMLHQIGMNTFLCRGGSLSCSTINTGKMRKTGLAAYTARNVIGIQNRLSVMLPTHIDSLVVIHSGPANPPPSIELEGWSIDSPAQSISREGSHATVWGLVTTDDESDLGEIRISVGDDCRIDSVVGLRGASQDWFTQLESGPWMNLVEEGPLSNRGSATLKWQHQSGGDVE